MESQLLFVSLVSLIVIVIGTVFIRRNRAAPHPQTVTSATHMDPKFDSSKLRRLTASLTSALPNSVILPHDESLFKEATQSYWAQQACEAIPACVIQPRTAQELSEAIKILKNEFDATETRSVVDGNIGLFAIRGCGHSPLPGASSINGGVTIDLRRLNEVTPSEDGSSVVIGAGAKWMDVSKVLDAKGLAVVGGRNSAVGVGGLTLGGGLSFFSPRYGLVCSNILSYEIVLASGSVVTASASENPDLWGALKGGSNNFGPVTRFTARSFPSDRVWSGFLYMHSSSSQVAKVLAAFHESVNRANPQDSSTPFDIHAAGPLSCFSYVQAIGLQAISVNLVYTKECQLSSGWGKSKWPEYWRTSGFSSLWRLWSTMKYQSLTSATDEMNMLNPPGRRQVFDTLTVKNDPATLNTAHKAYSEAIAALRPARIKGLVWTLVLQPLLPFWVRKGDPNPLGLDKGPSTSLVIVMFTVNWDESRDDEFVKSTLRQTTERIEAAARARGTDHPWRYLNNCAEWQRPFEGYGRENLRFLQGVSKKYDPDGLFQKGCVGGFKLGIESATRLDG